MNAWRRHRVAAPILLAVLPAILALVAAPAPRALGGPIADAPAQATPNPEVVVEGRILYIDRESDRSHPAAGVKVEIWDKDAGFPCTGEKLDETVTDASGFFRSKPIRNVDPDCPVGQREGTQDIFMKLFTDNGNVRLFQTGTTTEFVWNSYEIDPQDGISLNVPNGTFGMPPLYVMENTPNVEALWTFVNLAEGWLFLRDQIGESPGEITAFWSRTSADGPRYDPAAKALFYRNDNAGYADVVVQQEAYALAHNVLGSLPADWSSCLSGPGEEAKRPSDAACAFIQGFATFFPLAVYNDPNFETPALRGDMDAPRAGSPGWSDGDTVAGRVAGAFWDLFEGDGTEDGYDTYNARFIDVWEVIQAQQPSTMAEWWAGWKAMGKDGCAALGSLFQNTIDYNTKPQIVPIPDIELNEDETKVVDLKQYVTDAECSDLEFRLLDAGEREAGVRLDPTGVVSITPALNWFGETTVRAEASDGPASIPFSFKVRVLAVNDCPLIDPPVNDPPTARYQEPIVLNLLPHGADVEDLPYQLQWFVEVDPQQVNDLKIEGEGTTTIKISMTSTTIQQYNARVELVVKDRAGCETRQALKLRWDSRPNQSPFIYDEKLQREYIYPQGETIPVDLNGVANDDEDGPDPLEWFVDPPHPDQVTFNRVTPKYFNFTPDDADFIGSRRVNLRVDDTGGLSARALITLTWKSRDFFNNIPPQILRNKLLGKTVGTGSTACYPLLDKAVDPDGPVWALQWFIEKADPTQVTVRGMGTRELCITPTRFDFQGCMIHTFLVADTKGGEDRHDVRTCWREIKIQFPIISQNLRFRPAGLRP